MTRAVSRRLAESILRIGEHRSNVAGGRDNVNNLQGIGSVAEEDNEAFEREASYVGAIFRPRTTECARERC